MIIAVDGPAGAGKGTVSRALAHHFSLKSIDSGLIYRALAFKALQEHQNFDDVEALLRLAHLLTVDDLANTALRQEAIGNAASKIAVLPAVRSALNAHIRRFCADVTLPYKGVVLDGRDIGTVVCPHADVKFFVTADAQTRAMRRAVEMSKDHPEQFGDMLYQIVERDQRDSNRAASPMVKAPDAVELDTTHMSITESCDRAIQVVEDRLKSINLKSLQI